MTRVTLNRRTFSELIGVSLCTALSQGCGPGGAGQGAIHQASSDESPVQATPDRLPPATQPYIDVVVRPIIVPVRQPSDSVCWAAVWTMILSWREGKEFAVKDAVARLGSEWVGHLERNEGLEAQTFREEGFLKASGLQAKPPANYLSSAYVELLASHGPLWINSGDGILNHATLLCGAQTRRDGRIDFRFVDPQEGKFVTKSDSDFFTEFEREARSIVDRKLKWDFRYQIFHW